MSLGTVSISASSYSFRSNRLSYFVALCLRSFISAQIPCRALVGHSVTVWSIDWLSAPQSHSWLLERPHSFSIWPVLPWPVLIRFSRVHIIRGRSKPGGLEFGWSTSFLPSGLPLSHSCFHVSVELNLFLMRSCPVACGSFLDFNLSGVH